MQLTSILAWGAALMTLQIPSAIADCCGCPGNGRCPDNTECSPVEGCCGYGPCNIFCCNCDDGCRQSSISLLRANHLDLRGQQMAECSDNIIHADTNQDGNLSFLEWVFTYTESEKTPIDVMAARWLKYDVEGKGYLTLAEALHRKAK